jgi:hypothetical protein
MPLPKLQSPLFHEVQAIDPVVDAPDRWPELAWAVALEVGLLLVIVGGADQLLTWYPLAFQNPEWEFGTVTATLDRLPALVLGLGLVLAGALHAGNRWLVRATAVTFILLALAIVAAGLLYATNVPLALRAIADPAVRIGLYKAMAKTTVQAIAYPSVCFWIALKAWR